MRAALLKMAAPSAVVGTPLTVSLIIPTKNEAKNLPYVLPRIPAIVTELILVDANSTDGTVEVARRLYPNVRVVGQTGRGKGNALRAGFEAAQGDIIVMLDADGSMAPEEIPAYIGALLAGADYAKGSRFLHGGGTVDMEPHRYLGNLGLTLAVRALFGGLYTDLCYGYCAFRRSVLPQLNLTSDGFEIETEMNVRALRSGMRVVEVPSFESERIYGKSNLSAIKDGLRVLRVILQERFLNRTLSKKEHARRVKDEFTPAMRLLIEEASNLDTHRAQLPQFVYSNAVETLKAASSDLLNRESTHPGVRRQQEIYRQSGDRLWRFLDADGERSQDLQQ